MNRLALGTVQFGLPYGVANSQGRVDFNEIKEILNYVQLSGVDTLDTAMSYGDSEEILGEVGVNSFRIISKLPSIPKNISNISDWIEYSVYNSLRRLKIKKLYGLLLHAPSQLLKPEGEEIFSVITNLKEQGLIDKLGISIYSPDELDDLCLKFSFDLVQSPLNILDRRLEQSGWLSKLKGMGVEVHARSVFLQGLLLMNSSERPDCFKYWQPLWNQWEMWLDKHKITSLQACLGFVFSRNEIDRILVGVDSLRQIQEIISISVDDNFYPQDLYCNDINLINPCNWQSL